MGNKNNITNEDFEKAAQASDQSVKQTKKNVYEALKKELSKE